jgi:hypothetical protein
MLKLYGPGKMNRAIALGIGIGLLVIPGVSSAQAPAAKPKAAPAATPAAPAAAPVAPGTTAEGPKVTVERGAGGKKVYRITDALRIEGKIQKPEAFYVLQKSSINYDWQDLKQDFIPKILESVAQAPF